LWAGLLDCRKLSLKSSSGNASVAICAVRCVGVAALS
jgi:hypothetical protein